MKADHINPFVKASVRVLNQFDPELSIEREQPRKVDSPYKTLGVTCYLGLTGALEGQIIYDMEIETARKVAGTMNGQDSLEINDLARSAIQELSNMISGNAVTTLKNETIDGSLDITPPSLIVGNGSTISDYQNKPFVQVPLRSNLGTFLVNLSISESQ
ncbi:MAG: chemotaxis protein CheX [bacterium]